MPDNCLRRTLFQRESLEVRNGKPVWGMLSKGLNTGWAGSIWGHRTAPRPLLASVGFGADPPVDEQARLLDQPNASYAARRPLEAVRSYREYLARYPDRADVECFWELPYSTSEGRKMRWRGPGAH